MPAYRFVTVWRLNAPIDEVYAAIDDIEAWPAWWPHVRSVERLDGGDAQGIGAIYRMTFVGRLPYRLRFDLRVMERVRPTTLTGRASGELEGTGAWTLREGSGLTAVRYVWAIRTRPAWMNLIAPLPFVDEIFRMNHHAVMRGGLRGIRRRLGGVDGTYTREE